MISKRTVYLLSLSYAYVHYNTHDSWCIHLMPLFATVYSAFREMVTLLAAADPDLTPQKQKMFIAFLS